MIEFTNLDKYLDRSLDLYNGYILNSTATFYTKPLEMDEFRKIVLPRDEKYESYAILYDDVFSGYIFYFPFNPRQAYRRTAEVTIYLVEEYLGKEIAGKALELIEERAKIKDIRNFIAKITEENARSIRFFEKQGYVEVGTLKNVGEKFGKVLSVKIYQKEL